MFPYLIQPIRPAEDAAEIAELVKTCFRPWLDWENLEYLRSLREEGLYARSHPLLTRMTSFPYKLDGVVCRDEQGQLLGLINAYYFYLRGERCCLLANVCVSPKHRREGIASRMLSEIEQLQSEEGIRNIYLQARMELPETVDFYRKRGFRVTDYRGTYILPRRKPETTSAQAFHLERVPASDMALFQQMMKARYPATVLWNLNCRSQLFRPGRAGEISNRLQSNVNRFRRVVDSEGNVQAWAAWQKANGFADTLWFIPNRQSSAYGYTELLGFLGKTYSGKKPLKLDVPWAGQPEFSPESGFVHYQTLAWMWKRL